MNGEGSLRPHGGGGGGGSLGQAPFMNVSVVILSLTP